MHFFAVFLFSHEPLIEFFVGCRWLKIRAWVINLFHVLLKRFHWGFLLAGFSALAMAAISWKLETSRTYWIWHRYDEIEWAIISHLFLFLSLICLVQNGRQHSMWHITIYTSSFLFLCSKVKAVNCENERASSEGNYVLTRQNSFSGGEQRDDR